MSQDRAISTMRDDMNRLRGQLFGAVEVTGMPEVQQAAMKKLIRRITYDAQANLEAAIRGPEAEQ